MDLESAVGISGAVATAEGNRDVRKLAADLVRGMQPPSEGSSRCPADQRIEALLNTHFADLIGTGRLCLPGAFVLPRHGISRELSLPAESDRCSNEY